ncbi:hypothetical protein [Candidatus Scalindua japonica]|uniref:hypothetical protein n=1 Tax=Candidatus Scalindua japonica TaxID=1284222 RepID=UPI0013A5B567|nr:hypothetical protein [Candidatus Scalindua japonica]
MNLVLSILFVFTISIFTIRPLFSSPETEYQEELSRFEQQLSSLETSVFLGDYQGYDGDENEEEGEGEDEDDESEDDNEGNDEEKEK